MIITPEGIFKPIFKHYDMISIMPNLEDSRIFYLILFLNTYIIKPEKKKCKT